jgi:hypothetical protein
MNTMKRFRSTIEDRRARAGQRSSELHQYGFTIPQRSRKNARFEPLAFFRVDLYICPEVRLTSP